MSCEQAGPTRIQKPTDSLDQTFKFRELCTYPTILRGAESSTAQVLAELLSTDTKVDFDLFKTSLKQEIDLNLSISCKTE